MKSEGRHPEEMQFWRTYCHGKVERDSSIKICVEPQRGKKRPLQGGEAKCSRVAEAVPEGDESRPWEGCKLEIDYLARINCGLATNQNIQNVVVGKV